MLPTAPRAALTAGFNEENVPHDPPFTAYVANLPYDCNEDDIMEFFGHLRVRAGDTKNEMYTEHISWCCFMHALYGL